MTFDELQSKTIAWAHSKNIIGSSDAQIAAQLSKAEEEFKEVLEAFQHLVELHYGKEDTKEATYEELDQKFKHNLKLEFGDLLVTIIVSTACAGFTSSECLEAAYNKIVNRKGKTVNGVFVKDN